MLDYTVRHRFTVRLDRANGTGWQPLSKKLHGALPGGEKAIALYLPLFAAVAAHYEAVPLAPRGLNTHPRSGGMRTRLLRTVRCA